jgi:hypothetical protein
MRPVPVLALCFAALFLGAGSAFAFQMPETNAPWPTPHQQESRFADNRPNPWSSTYSDEAARRLGMADGRWNAFDSSGSLGTRVNGGFDSRGAVLRVQW